MNFPSALPALETGRLRLRPFTPSDANAVQQLAGAAEVAATTARLPHPYPDGAAAHWIATHETLWRERRELVLAITLRERVTLVGAVGLTLDEANEKAELGYWIGVPYWGNGFATEAARALVEFGFRVIRLQRVQAHHLGRNPASGRVLLKLGMKREGLSPHAMKKNDRFEDIVFYGMLRQDWPESCNAANARPAAPG